MGGAAAFRGGNSRRVSATPIQSIRHYGCAMTFENLDRAPSTSLSRRTFLRRSAATFSLAPLAFASSGEALHMLTSDNDRLVAATAPGSGDATEGFPIRRF